MPELGEVEIVRLNLERWWVGRAASDVLLLDSQVLTRGTEAELEDMFYAKCLAARRRGKYLIVDFEGENSAIFHFRMTGKIVPVEDTSERFVRLAWRVDESWLAFKDARRLGHIELFGPSELDTYQPLVRMGPEPHDLDGDGLRLRVGRRMLKNALLDQSVIAGVGNIAVSEVFFRVGLHPESHADIVGEAQWDALAQGLIRFFDEVIEEHAADDITYVNQGGANPFDVYKREGEPCVVCGAAIVRTKVAGRSSYSCPVCQA